MKKVIVGLLGCGNIGSGVVKLIAQMREDIRKHYQLEIEIRRALVRSTEKRRIPEVPASILTCDPDQLLNDPEISIVLEFLGGEQPAAEYMIRALKAGKTVVTANKMALALHWPELQRAAEENGGGFYYEASVGGAMPIIRMLQSSLQANHITRLTAIINGTTNYLLTRMTDEGMDYVTVLAEAQRLGLAEPNPAADVEGFDAAYKLSILSSIAFHGRVPYDKVYREGITGITAEDIAFGKEMGYTLKLLAIGKRTGDTVEARVHPTFLPDSHPLARVDGSLNAIYIHGAFCQDMMLQGRGAGDKPTASAICGDILHAAMGNPPARPSFRNTAEPDPAFVFNEDWRSRYFIRMQAEDRPGVLAHVADTFAKEGISIASVRQKDGKDGLADVVIITHEAGENAVRRAQEALNGDIVRVASVIRAED